APTATAPADPAAAASPAISPNAAAAQADPAPVGNSPYTVQ
ncbi:SH3 domain-containing protein, partial [Adlercreutzia equolifaciens subsp. celatus]